MDHLERAYRELKEAIERKVKKDVKRRLGPRHIDSPRFKVSSGGMEMQERGDVWER